MLDERAADDVEVGGVRCEQRAVREHAVQALHDRVGAAQIVGHTVPAQAREQDCEALAVARVPPADAAGVAREGGGVGFAMRGVIDEHAVEQQLGADVRDRAPWTTRATAAQQAIVELAHERGRGGQAVERGIGRVVDLDATRDRPVLGGVEPAVDHGGEVGQHRAEQGAGLARGRAGNRCMPEEVHDPC